MPLPVAKPADVGLCPVRCQRLLDRLQSEIDRERLPGAVALIARRGKLALFEHLGLQDPATRVPMARDAIFRIYSMTKPVVSVAAMMLVEQGRLLLSDPVGQHLPAFAGQQVARRDGSGLDPSARPATVHDLLRHTAGLTYEFLGAAPVQQQYAAADIGSRARSSREFGDKLAALPLMFQPGSVWEYSRATDVLGLVVAAVSGQSLGDYLQEHIFEPLGMVDTAFSLPSAKLARMAEPFAHDPDGGDPMPVFDFHAEAHMEFGGGGLVSTARDYARFLQFLLNRGALDGVRLLSPITVDTMTSDHLGNIPVAKGASQALLTSGHGFGLGFAVRTAPGLANLPGSVGSYHWGGIAGTTFFVDPAQEMYAMLLIQAPNQREFYRPLFRNMVYAALVD